MYLSSPLFESICQEMSSNLCPTHNNLHHRSSEFQWETLPWIEQGQQNVKPFASV